MLHRSAKNRTSLVVAHKLKLVMDADLILVMENGTLVEQGTHANLVCRANSTYSRMWAQQRHGDENYFQDFGQPEWCEYDPVPESAADALALQALSNQGGAGWLW